jgi:glycosyltransferase involved in cell wall biosynthesis
LPAERDQQPLVAVVTGVYNGQPYLPQTLACVQAQTYPNLVHVVLDNASTDETPDAIARVAGGRVPILTRRNPSLLTQIANWNAAFAIVPTGARYVKLLAADDLMRADCIERLVAVAEANPDVGCVTAIDVFEDRVKPHGLDPARTVFDGREIARRLLQRDLHWMPFHQAFFRTTANCHTYLFNPEVVPGFDRDLIMGLLLNSKMGLVNEPLFYTRYHESNVTSALVADGALLCERLAELQRVGRELMTTEEVELQLRAELRIVLRHILLQRASSQPALAVKTLQRLADLGVRPGMLDYVGSVLTWPAYLARKKMREAAYRAVTPPIRVTEAEFLNLPVSSDHSRRDGHSHPASQA